MTCAYGAVYKELPTPAQLSAYSPWSIDRPEQIRAKMRNRKRAIVRSLRLGQADGDRKLAEKLAACRYRPGKRCYQPMCPSCVEGLRHSFIPEAATRIIPFIRKFNLPISWLCADLPGQRYQLGDLSMIELASLNRRVRRHYLHAGFPLVFSGIQLIIVEDRSTRARPFWQARVCSVIVGLAKRDLPGSIGDFYPHPWEEEEDMDLGEALCSTIEPAVSQEITYGCGDLETDPYELQPSQLRELAHCLARYEMPVRYSLIGCRLDYGWISLNPGLPEQLQEFLSTRRRASR